MTGQKNLWRTLSLAVLLMVMVLASFGVKAEAAEVTLKNPTVSTSGTKKYTWNCIWYGSYPQTEIVDKASTAGCYRRVWAVLDGFEINSSLYKKLKEATGWDSSDDIVLDGVKYRRVRKTTAGSVGKGEQYFRWTDSTTYHYFRYEPVKWRVLKTDGETALLLTDTVIDCMPFNSADSSNSWADSTIRTWLNSEFTETAFTSEESAAIAETSLSTSGSEDTVDRVFLLATADAKNKEYGMDTGVPRSTVTSASSYADAMGAFTCTYNGKVGRTKWTLRNAATRYADQVYFLGTNGDTINTLPVDSYNGIRPAITLDLEEADWRYAGTVNSSGTVKEQNAEYPIREYQTLSAPQIQVQNVSTGMKISWDAVEGAAQYRVFSTDTDGNWTCLGVTSGTSYVDTGAGDHECYAVACMNSAGLMISNISSYAVCYRVPTILAADLTISNCYDGVKVSCANGGYSYALYRREVGGTYEQLDIAADKTDTKVTFVDSTAVNGKTYYYKICAYRGMNGQIYWGAATGKKTVRLSTSAISSLTSDTAGKLTVTWKKNSKVTGYQIRYSTGSTFASGTYKTVTVDSAETLSRTISSLTKGKKYYVKVRGYKVVGDVKYYAGFSSVKNVVIHS